MSDDLVLSGAGSIAVADDELLFRADALLRMSTELALLAGQLNRIDRRVDGGQLRLIDAPISAAAAEDHIDRARALLESLSEQGGQMSHGLRHSAEQYGRTERINEAVLQQLAAQLGHGLGHLGPLLLLVFAPLLLSLGAGFALGRTLFPQLMDQHGREFGAWLRDNNELLTNPATVALLRSMAMSSDDFLAGWGGIPSGVSSFLGDEGIGLTGLHTSATLLLLIGGAAGLLGGSEVRVLQTSSSQSSKPPLGIGDRIERIPDATAREDGAQIRVERYEIPGQEDRFEVFIAGTVDFSLPAGEEPWDMTSNVEGVAGLPPASYAAVQSAMAEAGVSASSPVVFNGYSQGGLVATMLAASGNYNTHGLVTVGSPSGQVQLPGGFPVVAIEHTDDIVPAIGGTRVDTVALVVERQLYAGRDIPSEVAVPAHQLDQYVETARLLDEARSDVARETIATLDEFTADATSVNGTTWRAERLG